MNKLTIFYCVVFVAILAAFAWMSNEDYKAGLAAEAHAKHARQLAQRDAAERKSEFNFLAAKAERMTGIAAAEK